MTGGRILIVEDSHTQLERLRYVLEESGFSVTAASDGRSGLATAQEVDVDLVLSDVVMPEMDGYALCRAMREDPKLRGIPVVLLTSLTDPGEVIRALEGGATALVRKPYDDRHLPARLRDILADSRAKGWGFAETRPVAAIDVMFMGATFSITAGRTQILRLLLSTFEDAVHHNAELLSTQEELRDINASLEQRVAERTVALTAEIAERERVERAIKEQLDELHRLHRALLGRESRTLELKREVNELLISAGRPCRYPSAAADLTPCGS